MSKETRQRYQSVYDFLMATEPETLEFALDPLEVVAHFEALAYVEFPDPPFKSASAGIRGAYPRNQVPVFPIEVLEKVLPINPAM